MKNPVLEKIIQDCQEESLPKKWVLGNIQSILITTVQSLPPETEGLPALLSLSVDEIAALIEDRYLVAKNRRKDDGRCR